ncbi:MAG TPA: methyltransferase domain-containing protein [Longilinea sp.]|nr:methyltransferase domain-containing protein [Longilinea sp.]
MAVEDAQRWNKRYRTAYYQQGSEPRVILERALPYLNQNGLVLDLAMGLGANARWMVERGYQVLGVDISNAAVFQAKKDCPQLMAVVADLNEYFFPAKAFSTILNFYFLDREIIRDFSRILQPNGIAIVETLTVDMLEIKPDMPEEFLLQNGELFQLFTGWNILEYQEGWRTSARGGKKSVASLIARLPG